MNNSELKMLRIAMGLTISETASITQCLKRTYEKYESGDRGIPDGVVESMLEVAGTRGELKKLKREPDDPSTLDRWLWRGIEAERFLKRISRKSK